MSTEQGNKETARMIIMIIMIIMMNSKRFFTGWISQGGISQAKRKADNFSRLWLLPPHCSP